MPRIHLNQRGCSGRWVRYRILKPAQVEANELAVAKSHGESLKDMLQLEYNREVAKVGRIGMIVAYTDPAMKDPAQATWHKVDEGQLSVQWDTIFNTRETLMLQSIYDREHGVTVAEVEAILAGKVEELED